MKKNILVITAILVSTFPLWSSQQTKGSFSGTFPTIKVDAKGLQEPIQELGKIIQQLQGFRFIDEKTTQATIMPILEKLEAVGKNIKEKSIFDAQEVSKLLVAAIEAASTKLKDGSLLDATALKEVTTQLVADLKTAMENITINIKPQDLEKIAARVKIEGDQENVRSMCKIFGQYAVPIAGATAAVVSIPFSGPTAGALLVLGACSGRLSWLNASEDTRNIFRQWAREMWFNDGDTSAKSNQTLKAALKPAPAALPEGTEDCFPVS